MDEMKLELLTEEQRADVLDLLEGDYSLENREELVKYQESVLSVGKWISRPVMNEVPVELLAESLGVQYDDYFKKADLYEDLTDYLLDWSTEDKQSLLREHLYRRDNGIEWDEFKSFNNISSEDLAKELQLGKRDMPKGWFIGNSGMILKSKVTEYFENKKEEENMARNKKDDRNNDVAELVFPVDYKAMIEFALMTEDYEWAKELHIKSEEVGA